MGQGVSHGTRTFPHRRQIREDRERFERHGVATGSFFIRIERDAVCLRTFPHRLQLFRCLGYSRSNGTHPEYGR